MKGIDKESKSLEVRKRTKYVFVSKLLSMEKNWMSKQ